MGQDAPTGLLKLLREVSKRRLVEVLVILSATEVQYGCHRPAHRSHLMIGTMEPVLL